MLISEGSYQVYLGLPPEISMSRKFEIVTSCFIMVCYLRYRVYQISCYTCYFALSLFDLWFQLSILRSQHFFLHHSVFLRYIINIQRIQYNTTGVHLHVGQRNGEWSETCIGSDWTQIRYRIAGQATAEVRRRYNGGRAPFKTKLSKHNNIGLLLFIGWNPYCFTLKSLLYSRCSQIQMHSTFVCNIGYSA